MTRAAPTTFRRNKRTKTDSPHTVVDDRLVKDLQLLYPDPKSELDFINNFQLLIAVVLSAQCTDKKVNQVTPLLFREFPGFPALATASQEKLEEILRPINYFKTKARNVRSLAEMVVNEFGGEVPRNSDDLQKLPGVGQKTSNVVLGEMRVHPTLAVDTHVFRVARRLGLTKGTKPNVVEEDLKKLFPPDLWRNLHHWLILHGRRVCKAQRPLCSTCLLVEYCPHGREVRLGEGIPTTQELGRKAGKRALVGRGGKHT